MTGPSSAGPRDSAALGVEPPLRTGQGSPASARLAAAAASAAASSAAAGTGAPGA